MEKQRPQRQQKPQKPKQHSNMEKDYITVCKAIAKEFPLLDGEKSKVVTVIGLHFLLERATNNPKKTYVNMLHKFSTPKEEGDEEEKKESN